MSKQLRSLYSHYEESNVIEDPHYEQPAVIGEFTLSTADCHHTSLL